MRVILSALALASVVVPAAVRAEDAAASQEFKTGQRVFYANGGRLGTIYKAAGDGWIRIMTDSRIVSIPASTLTVNGDKKIVTSMSRDEVEKNR